MQILCLPRHICEDLLCPLEGAEISKVLEPLSVSFGTYTQYIVPDYEVAALSHALMELQADNVSEQFWDTEHQHFDSMHIYSRGPYLGD